MAVDDINFEEEETFELDDKSVLLEDSQEKITITADTAEDTVSITNAAKELAKKQRSVAISEFFERNKHILGFENPLRAMMVSLKEILDNSFDACEESNILPNIKIKIDKVSKSIYKIQVSDNGPGIYKNKIGNVFGQLLYGSKFHSLKQRRGQQGIGVSAVVLYSQITTNKPTRIVTKVCNQKAVETFLEINIEKNKPKIIKQKEVEVEFEHGTHIEVYIKGAYIIKGKKSIKQYVSILAIVNPFASIQLIEPDGEISIFERKIANFGTIAQEVKPHPKGLEIGYLKKLLANTTSDTLLDFLVEELYGISEIIAKHQIQLAKIPGFYKPIYLNEYSIMKLYEAIKNLQYKIPSESLSLITEQGVKAAFSHIDYDFITTYTSSHAIYAGNAIQIEGGLFYGGSQPKEDKINLIRVANRTPLLYQQGACAITKIASIFPWRKLGLAHTIGELPNGPLTLFIHVASSKIPYTSEAKEAIADVTEIRKILKQCIHKLAKNLKKFQLKEEILNKIREKEKIVHEIIPYIYNVICDVLKVNKPNPYPVLSKIMDSVVYCKKDTEYQIYNYTTTVKRIFIDEVEYSIAANSIITVSGEKIQPANQILLFDVSDIKYEPSQITKFDVVDLTTVLDSDIPVNTKLLLLLKHFYNQLCDYDIPFLAMRTRTKENIEEAEEGYWVLSGNLTVKSAKTIGGASQILKIIYCAKFFLMQLASKKSSTLREVYYTSEGWAHGKFDTQAESNYLIENLEVALGCAREDFRIWPQSNGHLFGPVIIEEKTRKGLNIVDCQKDVNAGGYVIPFDLEDVTIRKCTAKFVLAIETAGMYKRLIQNQFDSRYDAILVNLAGQPARATRRIIRKLEEQYNIPVLVFTDNDGWSNRICASIAYGSIKTAHLSSLLVTPTAKYLGLRASDVVKYELPSDKLTKSDRLCLQQLLSDPRFNTDEWRYQINLQLENNIKSEQQSLAKYGLQYVTDVYLPARLKQLGLC